MPRLTKKQMKNMLDQIQSKAFKLGFGANSPEILTVKDCLDIQRIVTRGRKKLK
jgi:hypothetical protein